jgi:hypothetical protein
MIIFCSRLISSSLISLEIKIASFTTCDRARSSTLVVNIVTVFCLLTFYIIRPLNSWIVYPYKLLRSTVLSANDVSLATSR